MYELMKRTQGSDWAQAAWSTTLGVVRSHLRQELSAEDGILHSSGLSGEYEQNGKLIELRILEVP